jgi:peptidoglycan hydrolase-like protein with peptidoglycan-binding domain
VSRKLMLLLLVPALVGAMVGVGAATLKGAAPAAAPEPVVEPSAEPSAQPELPPIPAIPDPPPPDPLDDLPAAERPEPAGPSFDVAAVQQRLAELRYYVGPVDGEEGPGTRSAVMAFQKVNGLGADGVVGPITLAALDNPVSPTLQGGPAHRLEIDLTKQVAYYVEGGQLVRIMPVSSGSGQTYTTSSGGTARSLTPVGSFKVQRRIRGVREAPLGTLYDPLYFYKGWAIHGSNSVPAYPASHGCVRVTRADAVWLFDRMPVGTTVVLYGGTHTFTAGSSAPGTDEPAGDVPTPAPEPPSETAEATREE